VLDFTTQQLSIGLGIAAIVALLAVALAVSSLVRLKRLRREYRVLRGDGAERDIFGAVSSSFARVKALEARVDEVAQNQLGQAAVGRHALQRFALIRYDAFEDMGGRLSFSAALLDDHGDGLVITSINGRSETRTYAKPVRGLSSEHNLSDEEREAIATAVGDLDRSGSRAIASQSL
jgi:putative hemolysin